MVKLLTWTGYHAFMYSNAAYKKIGTRKSLPPYHRHLLRPLDYMFSISDLQSVVVGHEAPCTAIFCPILLKDMWQGLLARLIRTLDSHNWKGFTNADDFHLVDHLL